MSKTSEIPWNRIGIEAIAIVGSILLAFAIDAWWAERLERADEEVQLDRIRTEFSTNIERIDAREFEKGILTKEHNQKKTTEPNGTLVTFIPDDSVFLSTAF